MNPEILAFGREDFEEETQFVKKPPSEYDTVKGEQLYDLLHRSVYAYSACGCYYNLEAKYTIIINVNG